MDFIIDGVKFSGKEYNIKEMIKELAELLELLIDYDSMYNPDNKKRKQPDEIDYQ